MTERHIYQKKRVIIPALTALIILILGTIVSINSMFYKSTDDAFVEGHIITVAPRVSGPVVKLLVEDNQEVKKGDLLLEIDPKDYEVKLKQTQAKLEEANGIRCKSKSFPSGKCCWKLCKNCSENTCKDFIYG